MLERLGRVVNVKVRSKKARTAVVSFDKVPNAYYYEISYSYDNSFKKQVKTARTYKNSYTLKKLPRNKNYYVRVKAVKFDLNGKKLDGKSSQTVSVKVK